MAVEYIGFWKELEHHLRKGIGGTQKICGFHAELSLGCLTLFPFIIATQGFLTVLGRGCRRVVDSEWGGRLECVSGRL